MDDDKRVKALIGRDHYRTQLSRNSHAWIADEPAAAGGHDEAPSPGDMLAGSLAACKAITVRMYADRKTWPLESVEVEAQITDSSTDHPSIETVISLKGRKLTEEQRERLVAIAGHCPMHKILEHGITITQIAKQIP